MGELFVQIGFVLIMVSFVAFTYWWITKDGDDRTDRLTKELITDRIFKEESATWEVAEYIERGTSITSDAIKRLETKDPRQLDIVVNCPYFYATERLTYVKPGCPLDFQKTIMQVHDETMRMSADERKIVMEDLADALSTTDTEKTEQWSIGDDGELVRKGEK